LNDKVQHDASVQVSLATDFVCESSASSSANIGPVCNSINSFYAPALSSDIEQVHDFESDITESLVAMEDDNDDTDCSESESESECLGGQLHGMRRDTGVPIINQNLPKYVAHKFGANEFIRNDFPRYILVDRTQLMLLFASQCPICHVNLSNNVTYVGAVLHNVIHCNICKSEKVWTSSPLLRRPRTYPLNVHISSSVILSGCQFGKLENFFRAVNARFVCRKSYERISHSYLQPAVRVMYSETQTAILSALRASATPRTLIGDAQADSPGTCAKNQSYAVIDYETGYITAIAVLDKRETQLVSTTMELHGLIRCLCEMFAATVPVNKICTDQHVMVCKFFRLVEEEAGLIEPVRSRKLGDTVELSIRNAVRSRNIAVDDNVIQNFRGMTHRLDVWHKAKAIQAKVIAAGQKMTCRILLSWSSAVRNHFWFACEMCNGDSFLLKVIWKSILYHVTGVHQWSDGECLHDPIQEGLFADEKPIIPFNCDAWRALRDIVLDDKLLKDMTHCCDYL
jgi:hypothetical protein